MPTLTRLALGASAVSALAVLGTALPANAQAGPSHRSAAPATTRPSYAPGTASWYAAARYATGLTKPTRAGHATHSAATRTTSTHSTSTHTRTTAARSAAAHPRATSTARTSRRARVTGGRTSENWSGYTQSARDLGRRITSISASWQVSRASQRVRGQSEAASDWVGIGGGRTGAGTSDPTLVQAGSTATIGRAGVANYYTWFETLPRQAVLAPLVARSGDRLSVSIGQIGADRWRIRMANANTGRAWATSVRYHSSGGSADWVTERPNTNGRASALAYRRSTSFRKARVNGAPAHFQPHQRVTMTDSGRTVSTPSGAEGAGDGFSVCSYRSSCGAGS